MTSELSKHLNEQVGIFLNVKQHFSWSIKKDLKENFFV